MPRFLAGSPSIAGASHSLLGAMHLPGSTMAHTSESGAYLWSLSDAANSALAGTGSLAGEAWEPQSPRFRSLLVRLCWEGTWETLSLLAQGSLSGPSPARSQVPRPWVHSLLLSHLRGAEQGQGLPSAALIQGAALWSRAFTPDASLTHRLQGFLGHRSLCVCWNLKCLVMWVWTMGQYPVSCFLAHTP